MLHQVAFWKFYNFQLEHNTRWFIDFLFSILYVKIPQPSMNNTSIFQAIQYHSSNIAIQFPTNTNILLNNLTLNYWELYLRKDVNIWKIIIYPIISVFWLFIVFPTLDNLFTLIYCHCIPHFQCEKSWQEAIQRTIYAGFHCWWYKVRKVCLWLCQFSFENTILLFLMIRFTKTFEPKFQA